MVAGRSDKNPIWLAAAVALALFAPSAAFAGDDCDGLDYSGQCDGTVVKWCESGRLVEIDCADYRMECGWDHEEDYHACIEANAGCDNDIPEVGECIGNDLIWCQDGQPQTLSCPEGTQCAWDDYEGFFDCVSAGSMNGGAESEEPDDGESAEEGYPGGEEWSDGDWPDEEEWDEDWQSDDALDLGNPIDAPPARNPSPGASDDEFDDDDDGDDDDDLITQPATGCNAAGGGGPLAPLFGFAAVLALAARRRS